MHVLQGLLCCWNDGVKWSPHHTHGCSVFISDWRSTKGRFQRFHRATLSTAYLALGLASEVPAFGRRRHQYRLKQPLEDLLRSSASGASPAWSQCRGTARGAKHLRILVIIHLNVHFRGEKVITIATRTPRNCSMPSKTSK
jgi:hypothetical protein